MGDGSDRHLVRARPKFHLLLNTRTLPRHSPGELPGARESALALMVADMLGRRAGSAARGCCGETAVVPRRGRAPQPVRGEAEEAAEGLHHAPGAASRDLRGAPDTIRSCETV